MKEETLVTKRGNSSNYCHFILLNDCLLVTTLQKEKYKVKHKITLSSLIVEDVSRSKNLKNEFRLKWEEDGSEKQYICSTNTEKEKKDWITILKKAIIRPV